MYAFNHPLTIFFFNDTPTTAIYTLSLHDALPISRGRVRLVPSVDDAVHGAAVEVRPQLAVAAVAHGLGAGHLGRQVGDRSEEHTSELQSRQHLVCRLLLEKKKYYLLLGFYSTPQY